MEGESLPSALASHAGGMDAMSIDMAVAGNSSSALGSIENCARINENGVQDADESAVDSLTFDTTADGVPPVDDNGTPGDTADDTGGMEVYGFNLGYPTEMSITSHGFDDSAINMLKRNTGASLTDSGDPVPEDDGAFHGTVVDTGSGIPESGSGVLSRLVIESSPATPIGVLVLTLTDAVHLDASLTSYFADVTNNASVAVNVACPPLDTDGDGIPNATDPDDDNDRVYDVAEPPCGSDPLDVTPPLSRPERLDGPFAGVDDDGDASVDEALPGGAGAYDCDGDGFRGSAEDHVSSYLPGPPTNGDQKTCQEYDSTFPNAAAHIKPSKRWPSDIASSAFSLNKINVQDLSSFTAPIRYLNQNVGTDPGDVRFDLVPGSSFGAHINVQDLAAITSGVTGFPPMLGGPRAFGGPACPYAP